MKKLVLAAVFFTMQTLTAFGEDGAEAAIQGTISDQISALQSDDFATAFSFASPTIQYMFGNSQSFGNMVRQGYPMVSRPADVRFLELRELGPLQVQKVLIKDQSGVFHVLEYQMISTRDGWQINGVQLLAPAATGA